MSRGLEEVVLLAAALADAGKALAVLKTFDGVDGKHGSAELGVKLAEDGLAEACRTARDDTGNDAADGVALAFHLKDEFFHLLRNDWIRTTHCVGFNETEIKFCPVVLAGDIANLLRPCFNINAELAQTELGDSTSHDTADGFACRGTSAATMIAETIFDIIGVVSMRGTEHVAQVVVVAAVLILVADNETDGCTGGDAIHGSRQQLYAVCFLTCCSETTLAGTTAVELRLDEVEVEADACGTAVNDATDGCAVALAKSGHTKEITEGIHHGIGTI